MKQKDQRKRRTRPPFLRKVHFDAEVWSYSIGCRTIRVRTPDGVTHHIRTCDISGISDDEMERASYKGAWRGIGPQSIKTYIEKNLRG